MTRAAAVVALGIPLGVLVGIVLTIRSHTRRVRRRITALAEIAACRSKVIRQLTAAGDMEAAVAVAVAPYPGEDRP